MSLITKIVLTALMVHLIVCIDKIDLHYWDVYQDFFTEPGLIGF
jgi:hypothetical protein